MRDFSRITTYDDERMIISFIGRPVSAITARNISSIPYMVLRQGKAATKLPPRCRMTRHKDFYYGAVYCLARSLPPIARINTGFHNDFAIYILPRFHEMICFDITLFADNDQRKDDHKLIPRVSPSFLQIIEMQYFSFMTLIFFIQNVPISRCRCVICERNLAWLHDNAARWRAASIGSRTSRFTVATEALFAADALLAADSLLGLCLKMAFLYKISGRL